MVPPLKTKGQGKGNRAFHGEVLDIRGAAFSLGISEKTLRARISRGFLPHHRWGSRVCFLREELIAFFQNLPGTTPAEAAQNVAIRRGTA